MGKNKKMPEGVAQKSRVADRPGGRGKFSAIAILVFMAAAFLSQCHGAPKISIENAKATLSGGVYGEAMMTMDIKNDGGADVLKGVSTDIPGAKAVFHVMEGKRMSEEPSVKIPAGKTTVFQVGGSHIMIENMPKDTAAGSSFTLSLTFEKSGQKQLQMKLEKAPETPMSM